MLDEDITTVLALLDERRSNLSTQRARLVNQLHALGCPRSTASAPPSPAGRSPEPGASRFPTAASAAAQSGSGSLPSRHLQRP